LSAGRWRALGRSVGRLSKRGRGDQHRD
jgi:hypothetical protein